MTGIYKDDLGRLYAECILFWMLENATEGQPVEDFEIQKGSGLPDFEFQMGMDWLIRHRFLAQHDELVH